MKRQALIVMAATLALLSADASFARSGGGLVSGGSMSARGLYGQQAPESPTRLQTRDPTKDQLQIKDQLQTRDPLTTQDQLRTHDQDRIHQPWTSDDVIGE